MKGIETAEAQRRGEEEEWKGKSEFGFVHGPGSAHARAARIDLGLTLLSMVAKPGVPLSQHDIAAWCGCARGYIYCIERKAMKKLRNRLLFCKDERLREMVAGLFEERRPAQRKEIA